MLLFATEMSTSSVTAMVSDKLHRYQDAILGSPICLEHKATLCKWVVEIFIVGPPEGTSITMTDQQFISYLSTYYSHLLYDLATPSAYAKVSQLSEAMHCLLLPAYLAPPALVRQSRRDTDRDWAAAPEPLTTPEPLVTPEPLMSDYYAYSPSPLLPPQRSLQFEVEEWPQPNPRDLSRDPGLYNRTTSHNYIICAVKEGLIGYSPPIITGDCIRATHLLLEQFATCRYSRLVNTFDKLKAHIARTVAKNCPELASETAGLINQALESYQSNHGSPNY